MAEILTQWAFHRVKEHTNRNSDEKVMTFRSWRSHMTNCLTWAAYLTWPDGHFRPVQTPTTLPSGPTGNFTQWSFHEVQEHPNRSSNEGDITFRSWRSCVVNFDELTTVDDHCLTTTVDDHFWTTTVDDHCLTTPVGRPLLDDHCWWTTTVDDHCLTTTV